MKYEKMEKIYNNWINGNGDDRQAYKNMSKLELLDFIEYCSGQGTPRFRIINRMRSILSIKVII